MASWGPVGGLLGALLGLLVASWAPLGHDLAKTPFFLNEIGLRNRFPSVFSMDFDALWAHFHENIVKYGSKKGPFSSKIFEKLQILLFLRKPRKIRVKKDRN